MADALSETYISTIDTRLIGRIIELFEVPSNARITFAQFRGMAAFSERYLFNIFRRFSGGESQLQKDVLEILDFSSLKWKLTGVTLSSSLEEILRLI